MLCVRVFVCSRVMPCHSRLKVEVVTCPSPPPPSPRPWCCCRFPRRAAPSSGGGEAAGQPGVHQERGLPQKGPAAGHKGARPGAGKGAAGTGVYLRLIDAAFSEFRQ